MQENLAILIIGEPNSGKTTTLKHFCNTYHHKKVDTFKIGWRYGLSPWRPKYWGVKIDAYIIPASRTERGESLEETLEPIGWDPSFIFMAEQLHGREYNDTIRCLRKRNYHIKEFRIENHDGETVWHRFNESDRALILGYRAEEIAEYVRRFILTRI